MKVLVRYGNADGWDRLFTGFGVGYGDGNWGGWLAGLEVGVAVGGDDIIRVVDGVAALEIGCVAFLRTTFLLHLPYN